MPKRSYPQFLKGFGEYLRSKRGKLSWGKIKRLQSEQGVPEKLTSSKISMDEQGKTKAIPPERLKTYSLLYGVPYEEMVRRYSQELFGTSLEGRMVAEPDLYPPENIESHQWLEWILTHGTNDQIAGIKSNLKAFIQAIHMDSGNTPEGFLRPKKGEETRGES